jgi:3-hydroxymyristoyl/3-hydroxydecanoyl-(acyl carrier protein) dehydratase
MNALPAVIGERRNANHSELDILVADGNPWFEGHFPDHPILPGVVQIAWAVHYAGILHGFTRAVHTLEQVKFKRSILPDTRLTLYLTADTAGRVRYEYRDAQHSYASGVLDYGTAP